MKMNAEEDEATGRVEERRSEMEEEEDEEGFSKSTRLRKSSTETTMLACAPLCHTH
jgi:hypothetical protein